MTRAAHRCNAAAPAPWAGIVRADPPQDRFGLHDRLVCELDREHPEDHADFLENLGRGDPEVWVWWTHEDYTYVTARPCERVDPTVDPMRQTACTLYVEHPGGHSWEFTNILNG
ncbi:MAG TPA: hypothetical protein VN520_00980 [Streptomyces sp.]|uniref:hypothetical protein n=1 Tax=Streptomyces sp. TaxID=1931 RepID=UPI002B667E38|nr:hypothetical protein [Streptomyces sp.]HWU04977.1 hypothetical protein [Streptomyces sp.]